MAFDIHVIIIFLILALLSLLTFNSKKEWKQHIVIFLWSCYIIYMLCFKNNIYD